jgi:hypothetical protein
MVDPGVARGIRGQQRRRAFAHGFPFYALPSAEPARLFRVRALRTRLVRRGPGWQLERPNGAAALSAEEAKLAEWVLSLDYFSADEAVAAQRGLPVPDMLERFCAIGLIDEI